ncbi:DUF721 domain-containing protein [Mycoavidus sp. SF9855]|uniref:DUF721 domain-containing protein n=1 Tax=Mycoavidus sp. SF9855 TaxID=2968475 RepID=UPI00211B9F8C|nr:DUF721 domain-containing protein [Mycoavidus sp. SF9855]UUM21724.1 DUF721 domain-containing protein [Mycoavidus sp. SF9855]
MNPAYLTKSLPTRSTPSLVSLLERNEAFAQLRTGVEQIAALERDLAAALPDYLAPNVSPGPIKNGLLTLLTAHNALAARLRHLEPGLLQALQQRGWLVHAIKIRVQLQHAKPTSVAKKTHLSRAGFTCLQALRQKIAPSPLQTAVAQMIEHQAKNFREQI